MDLLLPPVPTVTTVTTTRDTIIQPEAVRLGIASPDELRRCYNEAIERGVLLAVDVEIAVTTKPGYRPGDEVSPDDQDTLDCSVIIDAIQDNPAGQIVEFWGKMARGIVHGSKIHQIGLRFENGRLVALIDRSVETTTPHEKRPRHRDLPPVPVAIPKSRYPYFVIKSRIFI